MKILAIETSCDETAASIVECGGASEVDFVFKILSNTLISQIDKHIPYGGVFPNVAKREHANNLIPVLQTALHQAGMLIPSPNTIAIPTHVLGLLQREHDLGAGLQNFCRQYARPPVDALAVTVGPGLEPALWVGINFVHALSLIWNIPIVPINHMEGHILIALLKDNDARVSQKNTTQLPATGLLVSGGHTELVLVNAIKDYRIIGKTRDDAAGECFDKCARMLGLPYPGGPEISRLAAIARSSDMRSEFKLPRPMLHSDDYDFSFSGLKTALRRELANNEYSDDDKPAIAREIEDAIVDVLVHKTIRSAREYNTSTILIGGGVSANEHLQTMMTKSCNKEFIRVIFPDTQYTTDNALMIAIAAYFYAKDNKYATKPLIACGNLSIQDNYTQLLG